MRLGPYYHILPVTSFPSSGNTDCVLKIHSQESFIWMSATLCSSIPTWRIPLLTENRCTTWELWVKFYLRQDEDCSPGGSISESSERLLQSGSGGKSIYKVLVKGEFNATKHSFYKRLLLVMRMSPWRDLGLLSRWEALNEEMQGLRS